MRCLLNENVLEIRLVSCDRAVALSLTKYSDYNMMYIRGDVWIISNQVFMRSF